MSEKPQIARLRPRRGLVQQPLHAVVMVAAHQLRELSLVLIFDAGEGQSRGCLLVNHLPETGLPLRAQNGLPQVMLAGWFQIAVVD